ncbi:MAG TPA: peptidoglycan DD-metalloendopeptidase family protein [Rhizomicrobium sp.]|jgi:murein DD-endopeptidase MepM/ murein hydrolase activator NlpD
MVWNMELGRAATLLAALIIAGMFLAGCVEDSPRTYLDWGPVRDTALNTRQGTNAPLRLTTPSAPEQTASLYSPAPRTKPAWYTASNLPAPTSSTSPTATVRPALANGTTPTFSWPLTGRVISDFGTESNGERNDGINIAAQPGTPIRASAAGTISYAGNELRGYGNLILIKHDDGYVTAYAHAERITVQRGDTVTKGQIIAYAGSTGDVTSPQLHFEIRHGVEPVNPRSLLVASNG